MKLSKEDQEIYRGFAQAAMQGWLARYPSDASFANVNYGVVAASAFRMAASMLRVYKQTQGKELKVDD